MSIKYSLDTAVMSEEQMLDLSSGVVNKLLRYQNEGRLEKQEESICAVLSNAGFEQGKDFAVQGSYASISEIRERFESGRCTRASEIRDLMIINVYADSPEKIIPISNALKKAFKCLDQENYVGTKLTQYNGMHLTMRLRRKPFGMKFKIYVKDMVKEITENLLRRHMNNVDGDKRADAESFIKNTINNYFKENPVPLEHRVPKLLAARISSGMKQFRPRASFCKK